MPAESTLIVRNLQTAQKSNGVSSANWLLLKLASSQPLQLKLEYVELCMKL
jgi:hypothetical protein